MPTILRVEDKSGKGPYVNGAWGLWAADDDYAWNFDAVSHPPPCNDALLREYAIDNGTETDAYDHQFNDFFRPYRFGFLDANQYKNWFSHIKDEEVSKMRLLGYVLSTYEVDEKYLVVGTKQIAFKKQNAKLIKQEKLP